MLKFNFNFGEVTPRDNHDGSCLYELSFSVDGTNWTAVIANTWRGVKLYYNDEQIKHIYSNNRILINTVQQAIIQAFNTDKDLQSYLQKIKNKTMKNTLYKTLLEQLRNTPPSEVWKRMKNLGLNEDLQMYVFMNSGDLDIPTDTLVIKWKPTADGLILSLDYNSSEEEEQVAYEKFTESCNQAVMDNVLPVVLGKPFWYTWKEITENSLPKQYSVIYSPNDECVVCTLHWDSRYETNFFAR